LLLLSDDDTISEPSWQTSLAGIWRHLEHDDSNSNSNQTADCAANLTVTQALDRATNLALRRQQEVQRMEVFVTGSLYLVGSALNAIQWHEPEAPGRIVVAES